MLNTEYRKEEDIFTYKMLSSQELKDFEEDLVHRYMNGEIRSPIHLSGGCEDQLIEIFKDVKPQDWIFTTYRSHYHALLKGMPKEELLQWVLDNKSIHLMNKEHKIVTSAIVGGTLSQALGCAMSIKLLGGDEKVWCFCGDMTASLGVFEDCLKLARAHKLPITFVIENNGMSTDTPSHEAWNVTKDHFDNYLNYVAKANPQVKYFQYERRYPHYGVGKRIDFDT